MLYGPYGTHYRVKLQVFLNFGLTPYPGGIEQIKLESKAIISSIYTIPGSTGNVCNYISFFPDKGVDKRGFPRIWPSYHGKARHLIGYFFLFGQYLYQIVQ